jgi:hypothetical protein
MALRVDTGGWLYRVFGCVPLAWITVQRQVNRLSVKEVSVWQMQAGVIHMMRIEVFLEQYIEYARQRFSLGHIQAYVRRLRPYFFQASAR